jgi:four helix bundle protein
MVLGAGRKIGKIKSMDITFRFENLEIWKDAIALTKELLKIANKLEDKKLYRFADQLRGAAMSISNNIAEGAGSFSDKEFSNYLNMARRSVFECANILIIIFESNLISEETLADNKNKLNHLSKKITNFRRSL